jgi:hypothetical protein
MIPSKEMVIKVMMTGNVRFMLQKYSSEAQQADFRR